MGESIEKKIRINKYLSEAGVCSRREADKRISEGRVTVDGHVALMGEMVDETSVVLVDGQRASLDQRPVLLLFYKPVGVVCSTKKQGSAMTVTEYLDYGQRIYPIGRLDKDSEGLLLMTNQGELSNALLKAQGGHEKEYLVRVDREVTEAFLAKMRRGVKILDTTTLPCRAEKTGKDSFKIILTQGLNRQIRRMCEALGYHVTSLKRVRVCSLTLDGLAYGQVREATQEEWEGLRKELFHE